MNLTKILRKNSRTLLMVFMSLLLVAFLIPQQIQGCGEGRRMQGIVRGEVYGEDVSTATLDRTRAEMRVLAAFGLSAPVMSEDPLDYYLLKREAERMGLRVGREEVIQRLRAVGMTDEFMKSRQQMLRRSYDEIYDIIGRLLAVDRLMQVQASAVFTSLPRLKLNFRNALEEAVADISVVPTRAFLPLVSDPTEEQLDAFFAECKDRETAHTSEELVFGYRLPDRVRIEYLTVDPEKIKAEVRVSAKDVREHFDDYGSRYTKPDPNAAPGQTPVPQVPMTFDEAHEQVRADVREIQAIEAAQSLVNEIRAEAYKPWLVTSEEDEFVPIPEGELVSFEALRERFSDKFPVLHGTTPLGSFEQMQTIPGLATAGMGSGQSRVMAPELAFRVKGLLEERPDDGKPVLNLMEPSPVLLTRKAHPVSGEQEPYQAYIFRVVQVAPSAAPESRAEVGTILAEDWKLVQAHDLAQEWAQKLAERAREAGLQRAAETFSELRQILEAAEAIEGEAAGPAGPKYLEALEPVRPSRLTRNTPFAPKIGSVGDAAEELLELADVDQPHPVAVVPQASEFRFLVGELIEVKPVHQATFDQQLGRALQQASRMERSMFGMGWADPQNVQARTGFTAIERADGEQTPEP